MTGTILWCFWRRVGAAVEEFLFAVGADGFAGVAGAAFYVGVGGSAVC